MQPLKTDDARHDRKRRGSHDAGPLECVQELIATRTPLALFLDVDGTLVEMALTPSTVRAPPGLPDILSTIAGRLSDALAIVTGRPLADADKILWPAKFAGAGVHGAEVRLHPGGDIQSLTPSFDPALTAGVRGIAAALPGVVLEDKGNGIALHYRLAPEHQSALVTMLEALAAKYPDQFMIWGGRKVFEILPVGFSKGRALRQLAALPNFAKRVPVMIGDDIADADAFRAAEDLGGYGLKVAGEYFSVAEAAFDGPSSVFAWLKMVAQDI